jgi:hypothetical protein
MFPQLGYAMDPFTQESSRAALIRIAREVAGDPTDGAAFLRRFRAAYLHLSATVDGASARAAAAMSGWTDYPIPADMMPKDPEKLRQSAAQLLASTDETLEELG